MYSYRIRQLFTVLTAWHIIICLFDTFRLCSIIVENWFLVTFYFYASYYNIQCYTCFVVSWFLIIETLISIELLVFYSTYNYTFRVIQYNDKSPKRYVFLTSAADYFRFWKEWYEFVDFLMCFEKKLSSPLTSFRAVKMQSATSWQCCAMIYHIIK